jgi:DNA-binding transcriptional ArsR family regulator
MNPSASTTGAFQPTEQLTITTLETLKVFSDPLRQQIIEALIETSKTVKQVAAELELAPTKLYYHVNLLEEHGLIRVTETRIVSGIIEKHYQSAARSFAIHRTLLTPGQEVGEGGDDAVDAAFNAMIEPIRAEIHKSIKQGVIDMSDDSPPHRKLRMWRANARMTPEEADAFYARLTALVKEFSDARADEGDSPRDAYSFVVGIYPTAAPSKGKKPSGN